MKIRKVFFWLHLIAGIVAGVIILIMSVTGAALAFEKEIVAWAERDARRVAPPAAEAQPKAMEELLAALREQRPGERPSGIVLNADPSIALLVSYGRTNSFYVNPYTGEARAPGGEGVKAFMHVMIDWHRFLGGHDEGRARGKAITGACNAAFLFLAVSGLYLWWPRQWTAKAVRAVGLMNFKLRGKARDFNWHNALGLWTAPVLIVLTATALPISYRWAGDLIYALTGTPAPAPGAAGPGAVPVVTVPTPPEGSRPLSQAALFAAAQKEMPQWKLITLRAAGPGGRGGGTPPGGGRGESARTNETAAAAVPASGGRTNETRERGERRGAQEGERNGERRGESGTRGGEGRGPAPAVTLAIVEKNSWPLFKTTQLTLDPYTGAVLKKEGYGDQNLGRQVRSWTRFLHTGEALGTVGKAVAGLASAIAAVLVWTGFALTWRRFFSRRAKGEATPVAASGGSDSGK